MSYEIDRDHDAPGDWTETTPPAVGSAPCDASELAGTLRC